MRATVRTWLLAAVDAVWPQVCAGCGQPPGGAAALCDACHAEVHDLLHAPACRRCGRSLPPASIHETACARCRRERHWNLAGVVRVGTYTTATRTLLLDLKYRGRERNSAIVGAALALAIASRPWAAQLDALVPVPMHRLRRLQRPCDHARLLAAATGDRLDLPVWPVVRRAHYRPSQTGQLSRSQRFANVQGCFQPGWQNPTRIKGKSVCIIDNLLMTGATVCEVSKVLRRLGARRIYAAVVARPPAPGDPPSAEPEPVALTDHQGPGLDSPDSSMR